MKNFVKALVSGFLLSTLMATTAAKAAQACEPVRFKPGSFSATVRGTVDPEGVRCYEIATGNGQTAELSVKSTHNNTMFSIEGVVDGQDQYKFRTEKKTYRILVGQLMKAIDKDSFALTITIR